MLHVPELRCLLGVRADLSLLLLLRIVLRFMPNRHIRSSMVWADVALLVFDTGQVGEPDSAHPSQGPQTHVLCDSQFPAAACRNLLNCVFPACVWRETGIVCCCNR